jgi:hypothetical protein
MMKKTLNTTKTEASQKIAHVGRRKRRGSGVAGAASSGVSTSSDSPRRYYGESALLFQTTNLGSGGLPALDNDANSNERFARAIPKPSGNRFNNAGLA